MSTVARLSFKLSRLQVEQFERVKVKAKEARRWFSTRPVGHSEVFQFMLDRLGSAEVRPPTSTATAQVNAPRPVRPPAARGGQTARRQRPRQVTLTEAIRRAKKRGGK